MIPIFIGILTCLSAFFRSRYHLGLKILPGVSSWVDSSEEFLALGCQSRIEYVGFCSAALSIRLAPGCLKRSLRKGRIFRAGTDQCLMLRRTAKLVPFPKGLRDFSELQLPDNSSIQVHESLGDRLLATDRGLGL
jgi:hypothetical protein